MDDHRESEFIGTLNLRNLRQVYQSRTEADHYIVRQISKNQVYEARVSKHNVETLADHLQWKRVAVDDVDDMVEDGDIDGLNLRFPYGYKRGYELQEILVVMCVLGLARMEKEGNGFRYFVRGEQQ